MTDTLVKNRHSIFTPGLPDLSETPMQRLFNDAIVRALAVSGLKYKKLIQTGFSGASHAIVATEEKTGQDVFVKLYCMSPFSTADNMRALVNMKTDWKTEHESVRAAYQLSKQRFPDLKLFPEFLYAKTGTDPEIGDFYISCFELITRPNLTSFTEDRGGLERGGAISEVEAVKLLSDGFKGLAVLHELGIIHRDIRPQNVHFDGNNITLTDLNAS